jgi:hypothetical protein
VVLQVFFWRSGAKTWIGSEWRLAIKERGTDQVSLSQSYNINNFQFQYNGAERDYCPVLIVLRNSIGGCTFQA